MFDAGDVIRYGKSTSSLVYSGPMRWGRFRSLKPEQTKISCLWYYLSFLCTPIIPVCYTCLRPRILVILSLWHAVSVVLKKYNLGVSLQLLFVLMTCVNTNFSYRRILHPLSHFPPLINNMKTCFHATLCFSYHGITGWTRWESVVTIVTNIQGFIELDSLPPLPSVWTHSYRRVCPV